nr:hypothetical protein GCM10020093_099870 [Planobispora longispora]
MTDASARPLRRQRDYRLLLSARAVSETGTEISRLAVPLTAATLLGASPPRWACSPPPPRSPTC